MTIIWKRQQSRNNKDETRKREAQDAQCEISDYRREADEIYILAAYYAASGGDVQNECSVLLIVLLHINVIYVSKAHIEVQPQSLTTALHEGESSVSRTGRLTP